MVPGYCRARVPDPREPPHVRLDCDTTRYPELRPECSPPRPESAPVWIVFLRARRTCSERNRKNCSAHDAGSFPLAAGEARATRDRHRKTFCRSEKRTAELREPVPGRRSSVSTCQNALSNASQTCSPSPLNAKSIRIEANPGMLERKPKP